MMTGLEESTLTQALRAAPEGEMEPTPASSTEGIAHPTNSVGSGSEDMVVAPNPVDAVPPSEREGVSHPPPPGEPSETRDTGVSPGQSLVDPPPALIEKISLTDETTTSPNNGKLHEERPRSESNVIQGSTPSNQDLTSGSTKTSPPETLHCDSRHPEPETLNIHGRSHTTNSPPSSSASHAGPVSNTSLPALSRIVMPYGLTNDAGRPLSPPAATQMDPTVPRPIGLPASPSFNRPDVSHPESHHHHSHHRSSIDHSALPTLPTLPGLSRHRSSRSPSGARSPPLSDSSEGSIHLLPPITMDSSSSGSHQATGPPLLDTEVLQKLVTPEGHIIRPEIHARIDKGFFLSDNDWTCYRRNYFSVGCSYSLFPHPSGAIYLQTHQGVDPVAGFAVKISAAVEGAGGKPVELVQHTPKRDKGPQMQPGLIKLVPQSATGNQFTSAHPGNVMKHGPEYDYNYPHTHIPHQPVNQAVYDRIQFKSATANNGKRRAAQQYYHLVVELYAEIVSTVNGEADNSYALVAKRISAPMVVRGRSPGHYVDERKHNRPTSAGPDGKGSGTQPSTPATSYAPGIGLPSDHHSYYAKPAPPGVGADHEHYGHPLPNEGDQPSYSYYPQALNHPYDSRPNHTPFNGYYISGGVHEPFKGYQPVGISCTTYGDSTYGYIPSSGRSRVKNEGVYNSLSWPRDTPRVEYQRNHGGGDKLYSTESSTQHYPSLPTL